MFTYIKLLALKQICFGNLTLLNNMEWNVSQNKTKNTRTL